LFYDVKQVALISNAFLGHLTRARGSTTPKIVVAFLSGNISKKYLSLSLRMSCEARQIINKLNYTNFQAVAFRCPFGLVKGKTVVEGTFKKLLRTLIKFLLRPILSASWVVISFKCYLTDQYSR
jgi:hypothetical protein